MSFWVFVRSRYDTSYYNGITKITERFGSKTNCELQDGLPSQHRSRVYFHSAVDCDNGPAHCFCYTKESLQSLQEKESKQSVNSLVAACCTLIRMFFIFLITVPPACLLDSSLGVHEYVTANGIKFHCVAAGDRSRPLMLFLHGFPEVNN